VNFILSLAKRLEKKAEGIKSLLPFFSALHLMRNAQLAFESRLYARVFFRNNRKDWSESVRGRSIAIVGPAPLDRDYSVEIDGHDLVIRVGYEHWPWKDTGIQTDVWVLDAGASHELMRGELQEKEVTWFLLKLGWTDIYRYEKSWLHGRTESRGGALLRPARVPFRFHWASKVRPDSINLNQVPLVLMELLLMNPGPVSVYGSDFYTRPKNSYGPASPAYERQRSDSQSFITKMLESHNQVDQRKIVKVAQNELGALAGDRLFLELLALNEEEFEQRFSGWYQA